MAETLWEATNGEPLLALAVTTTLADHIAFNRYLWTLPNWRERQVHMFIAVVAMAPLVALGACYAIVWALSGAECDLDSALGIDNRGLFFAKLLGGVLLTSGLVAGLLWLWRRRILKSSVRAALLRRPHIRADDPELRETSHVSIHARGYRVSNLTAAYAYTWTHTQRFDETPEHLFIMGEQVVGFVIPKRDLPDATLLTIRDIARQVRDA